MIQNTCFGFYTDPKSIYRESFFLLEAVWYLYTDLYVTVHDQYGQSLFLIEIQPDLRL